MFFTKIQRPEIQKIDLFTILLVLQTIFEIFHLKKSTKDMVLQKLQIENTWVEKAWDNFDVKKL